ncbi:Fpg/Nei family DNA glycosylase [Acidicapsa dinghuensis]|uniref:DNA-(apurinic or apyrimidinic site) lyase n=1 Tax=Acidicapsa dinghuensis TaxID=2218256 RepID=A0ABW1EKG4_9BACT|nr:DNA-formamidopyrimidine glycosylase family protein [Acidicapsa dinghuensis]
MPEGDTIFRTARTLSRALVGKTVTRFHSEYAQLASANDQHPFTGQIITKVEARGKYLLMHFADPKDSTSERAGSERILATHMLMSGSWHIYRLGEPWQDSRANMRILIETADFVAVGFRIPVARLHTPQTLTRDKKIPQTERDVLSEDFDAKAAVERLQKHGREELGNALVRQDVLAGVGNVFKSEICFLERISPFRKVDTLTDTQIKKLVAAAQKLLAANVLEDSGDLVVTFSGKQRRTTHSADPGDSLWVYGRKGEPCRRCSTTIQRALQQPNARSTYWCPVCQPLSTATPQPVGQTANPPRDKKQKAPLE